MIEEMIKQIEQELSNKGYDTSDGRIYRSEHIDVFIRKINYRIVFPTIEVWLVDSSFDQYGLEIRDTSGEDTITSKLLYWSKTFNGLESVLNKCLERIDAYKDKEKK